MSTLSMVSRYGVEATRKALRKQHRRHEREFDRKLRAIVSRREFAEYRRMVNEAKRKRWLRRQL